MSSQGRNLFDRVSDVTGKVTAWLTLLMVVVTVIVVIMRYVFDAGLIWLQESVIWMHAAVFMVGAAYTLLEEEHVRVDIFYRKMNPRRRAIVDLVGAIVFLLPLCVDTSRSLPTILPPYPGQWVSRHANPVACRIRLFRS